MGAVDTCRLRATPAGPTAHLGRESRCVAPETNRRPIGPWRLSWGV